MEDNTPKTTHFSTGKREIRFGIGILVIFVFMADFWAYGGLNLGFAVTAMAGTVISALYLIRSGCRPTLYSGTLLVLALVCGGSFVRSDDALVEFVMLCLLLLSGSLGLTLMAGKNRRSPNGVTSLLDGPMAVFTLGIGELSNAFGGLNDARKNAGTNGKKNIAVLAGLAIAVPVLAILIPLLISADAAFEGLMLLLPEVDFTEPIIAIVLGVPAACVVYTRNTALKHAPAKAPSSWAPKSISHLTVNTVLAAVSILYAVYLFSQLAYFVGGFSGILPQGYTVAEYARRGFFEMAWLSAINLGIITVAIGLCDKKNGRAPLSVRLLCLFIGLVTLFFAVAASGKMLHYIGSYGLTRLRLLTQVIIVFLALAVVFVLAWLFRPKFAYMKALVLTAMLMASAVAWTDVDTVVAAYNVGAYQSGQLETIDVSHLRSLGDGAVPYLLELTKDDDPLVAEAASDALCDRNATNSSDLRSWNYVAYSTRDMLMQHQEQINAKKEAEAALRAEAKNHPLRILTNYVNIAETSRQLTHLCQELPPEEIPLLLYLQDLSMHFEDGTPFLDIPIPYDTRCQFKTYGVTAIEITENCVLFRTDDAPNSAMVWTEQPENAQDHLCRLYPGMLLIEDSDNWYVMVQP